MKLRLFVGITAPAEWKIAVTEFRKKVQPKFSASFAKWTAESNLHLTLRFFGSVEESEVTNSNISKQTRTIKLEPRRITKNIK